MFKSILLTVVFALVCSIGYAATLEFSWQANPVEEQIPGYRLYMDCGSPTCVIAEINDPAATTFSYTTTTKIPHTFSLTAFRIEEDGTTSESGQSAYAIYNPKKMPLLTPRSMIFTVH